MSIKGIYDIHCHIVPGVDDGATDIGETVKLLRMEYEQGVRTVITTPHFRFRMFETPAEKVREQFRLVEKAASEISRISMCIWDVSFTLIWRCFPCSENRK